MYLKTEIAKDIERADVMIQYDAQCKKVLSNKYILSWIMQAVIEEYENLSRDFIRRCIENEPEIGTFYVEPKKDIKEENLLKNTKAKIEGLNTEDKDAIEGEITYDIRFAAFVPRDMGRMKILVNVEAQKNFYPGYPIVSRGVYYDARMISSQNGVEFEVPNYGDIKKVYSIWICVNAPKHVGNALTIYNIQKVDVEGYAPELKENYDKMSVAMVYLNQKAPRNKGFFDMMNTLLSPELDVETKKSILRNEYQIPMERGFVKEVSLMCNLSEGVYEAGIERGIEKERRNMIENLLRENMSDEFIMRVAEISGEKLKEIKEELLCMA